MSGLLNHVLDPLLERAFVGKVCPVARSDRVLIGSLRDFHRRHMTSWHQPQRSLSTKPQAEAAEKGRFAVGLSVRRELPLRAA
jgi:hypothetical protein